MKMLVDSMPVNPRDCLYGSNSTGKYRCKFDAHLCPIVRGGECPHLCEQSIAPIFSNGEPDPNQVVEKKPTRSRKRTNTIEK